MNDHAMSRRSFLQTVAAGSAAALLLPNPLKAAAQNHEPLFRISLAQWSLHRHFFEGKLKAIDFASIAKNEFGIGAIEYVNQFFRDEVRNREWIADLKQRSDDLGVKNLLIMCDGLGNLGDPDEAKRIQAVENHFIWVETAKYLGCHSIRVNAASSGTWDEQLDRAADGLHRLSTFASEHGLNVIVENHGGLSSNGEWLTSVIRKVDLPNCGTLPDFGNFRVSPTETYDRYKGVEELMEYAFAVSAKSHDFDENGNEVHTDYRRMMKIVLDAGYRGYVGIEYEGNGLGEMEGIRATQRLLETVRDELSPSTI